MYLWSKLKRFYISWTNLNAWIVGFCFNRVFFDIPWSFLNILIALTKPELRFDSDGNFLFIEKSAFQNESTVHQWYSPGVLVSFVTLWPNICDTLPLFFMWLFWRKDVKEMTPRRTKVRIIADTLYRMYTTVRTCNDFNFLFHRTIRVLRVLLWLWELCPEIPQNL